MVNLLMLILYFLEQCKGLLEPNSPLGLADKIIVIDDPVSSLSHNFVYEIAILIQKEIINKSFKQVFLFTHNLFFLCLNRTLPGSPGRLLIQGSVSCSPFPNPLGLRGEIGVA